MKRSRESDLCYTSMLRQFKKNQQDKMSSSRHGVGGEGVKCGLWDARHSTKFQAGKAGYFVLTVSN